MTTLRATSVAIGRIYALCRQTGLIAREVHILIRPCVFSLLRYSGYLSALCVHASTSATWRHRVTWPAQPQASSYSVVMAHARGWWLTYVPVVADNDNNSERQLLAAAVQRQDYTGPGGQLFNPLS